MPTFFTTLTIISQVLTIVIAIGGALAFFFHKWVGAWIDARFKRQLDEELKEIDQRFLEGLEEKKTSLAKELASDVERLKADLATAGERNKRELDAEFRRKAQVFEKNSMYYETFSAGYGNVITELYALDGEYLDILESTQAGLSEKIRSAYILKALQALNETRLKLEPLGIYQDTQLVVRAAKLFADLSSLMADGVRNRDRLDGLAYEKGLIGAEMQIELMRGV
jgi:Skp family chaperone for outer membrane proteins